MSIVLSELEHEITASEKISEDDKLNLISDLSTIQSQLSKTDPDKDIVLKMWNGIERIVTTYGFVELALKIAQMIAKISN